MKSFRLLLSSIFLASLQAYGEMPVDRRLDVGKISSVEDVFAKSLNYFENVYAGEFEFSPSGNYVLVKFKIHSVKKGSKKNDVIFLWKDKVTACVNEMTRRGILQGEMKTSLKDTVLKAAEMNKGPFCFTDTYVFLGSEENPFKNSRAYIFENVKYYLFTHAEDVVQGELKYQAEIDIVHYPE